MRRKSSKLLTKFSIFVVLLMIVLAPDLTTVYAAAPFGIQGNGTGEIYIDINSSPYCDIDYNNIAYGPSGCTWFVAARVAQLTGINVPINGGGYWYRTGNGTGFKSGQTMAAPAVLCWDGHVAILEKIEGNTAYISEGGSRNNSDQDHGYCVIRTCPLDQVTQCPVREGGRLYQRQFYGYVYLTGSTIQLTASSATDVTQTNAKIQGSCFYMGSKPSEVGLLLGTDQNSLSFVAADQINHNKNPFDIWYDINSEANITLSPGTTYYYQLYAIVNGVPFYSNVDSFRTEPQTGVTINATGATDIFAGNAVPRGNCSYTGSRPSEIGILFGTDPNNLVIVASDQINHWKNPFDIWYDLNKEAGVYLNSGMVYYYQLYALVDGQVVYSQPSCFIAQ